MATVLKSGRTPLREFTHKVRGVMQVSTDLQSIYPRASLLVILVFLASALAYSWHTYATAKNPRLLSGQEQTYALDAFNSIRNADQFAEEFSHTGERQKVASDAGVALARFQGYAHTKEGLHATIIMRYYLDAVHDITQDDIDLAHARWESNRRDAQMMQRNYDDMELISNAVPYIQAMLTRSHTERILAACRNESMSYIFPNHQPPVDTCIFSHDQPNVDRR